MTGGIRKEAIHTEKNQPKQSTTDNTRQLPMQRFLNQKEPLLHVRESLYPSPSDDMRWYRITSMSRHVLFQLLQKINPELARSRKIINDNLLLQKLMPKQTVWRGMVRGKRSNSRMN